jgi:hypothetical protein
MHMAVQTTPPGIDRKDGTPLVPPPAPVVNPSDFYYDPRVVNGNQVVK